MIRFTALSALLLMILSVSVSATIINVPADFPTIQMAIDSSSNGDIVLVQPDTYYGIIDFDGHSITLASLYLTTGDTAYISSTILDGASNGPVVSIRSGEDSTTMITGFTIQNGNNAGDDCGGISCENSEPTIANNIIRNNSTNYYGGGILCWNADAVIRENVIDGNTGGSRGGGISIYTCSPEITYNLIINNIAGQCGGGIYGYGSSSDIINNTVVGNSSGFGAGLVTSYSTFNVVNTILWNNINSQIEIWDGGPPIVSYSDIQGGYTGTGNIDCDPMFCDTANGNYFITSHACCYGAGENGVTIGAFGVGCGTPMLVNVPADYATIQSAIDACIEGDSVLVQPGTYVENINFNGKNIVIASLFLTTGDTSYISSTIIDGDSSGSVVSFSSGEDSTAKIVGFTIKNGFASNGGGILCNYNSNPTINYNNIIENSAVSRGGGVFCDNSSPSIGNNTISGNLSLQDGGGGIFCFFSNPTISYNTINGNQALGYGGGGGIDCHYSSPTISHNTIKGNSAYGGGGIFCRDYSPVIINTILWGDSAPLGPEIYLIGSPTPVITYCDVQGGWAGTGNINCDPLFCNPDSGNFHLAGISCCAGSGQGGDDIGAFGVDCAPYPPPTILSVVPSQNEMNVQPQSNISVTFDIDMDSTSINDSTFKVIGRWTGIFPGTISYDSSSRTATFDPAANFPVGDLVSIFLTTGIRSHLGAPLDGSNTWSFTVQVSDGTGEFSVDSTYSCGFSPAICFEADYDGDGDIDLAVPNRGEDSVSVLLNNGNGTFAPPIKFGAGYYPHCVYAGDFDEDGDNDLAVSDYDWDTNIDIYLNDGNGSFTFGSGYAFDHGPEQITGGDFNGDGNLDLAIVEGAYQGIMILYGNGDGTFEYSFAYSPLNVFPVSISASDLDNDYDLDLVVAHSSTPGLIIIVKNDGSGTFTLDTTFTVGVAPQRIVAVDLNNDGFNDLAISVLIDSVVAVYLNDGTGSFLAGIEYPAGVGPFGLTTGDLNVDGFPDLIATNSQSDNVSVLINNGDGTFAPQVNYATGDFPHTVVSADFNNDGSMDLATSNEGSHNVSILLNIASRCYYVIGDANHSESYNGLDITYGVSFFKGGGEPLCEDCPSCPDWWYCGDVNGSCNYNGLDITYGVAYFKGSLALVPCADCPPLGYIDLSKLKSGMR